MNTKNQKPKSIKRATHRLLPSLAILSLAGALGAQAELLVYEPFDYPDGPLTGQGGALGTTGTWTSLDTGLSAIGWWVHPEGQLTGVAVNPGYDPTNPDAPGILNVFDGAVDNLPTSGGFTGMAGPEDRGLEFGTDGGTGNLDASIALAPSVTASFQPGTTTWFSYVGAYAWDRNQGAPQFMICTDPTINGDRGYRMQTTNGGNGIGGTGGQPRANLFDAYPHYFQGGVKHESPGGYEAGVLGDHNGIVTSVGSTGTSNGVLPGAFKMPFSASNAEGFGAVNIVVGKIEWNAEDNGAGGFYDVITLVRFLETDELTEAAFDALVALKPELSSRNWPAAVTPFDPNNPSNKPDLDQSQFNLINFSSLKFFVDEIRIATTFGEVIGEGGNSVGSFPLTITPAIAPDAGYLLAWETQEGMLYRLRSSTDLSGAIATWNIVEEDIPATINTKLVNPVEPRFFYAVESYPVPPVTLLNENFDLTDGGFTEVYTSGTHWDWGAPISPANGGGTVMSDNGGTGKCWGTDVGDPGRYVAGTSTSLLSPVINLTDVAGATLTFAQALDIAAGHTLEVYVTDAAGTAIGGPIHTSTPDSAPLTADWKTSPAIAITGGQPVRLEWRFIGDGDGQYLGAYIDDVKVTAP